MTIRYRVRHPHSRCLLPAPINYCTACTICSTFVRSKAGYYLGKTSDGSNDVRCVSCVDVTPPAANNASKPSAPATPPAASKPNAPAAPRPAVSSLAFNAACAMLRASEGNAEARAVMGEIVEALAWIRGEISRAVTTYRDAADDLVASILGSRSGDTPADKPSDDTDPEMTRAFSHSRSARSKQAKPSGTPMVWQIVPGTTHVNTLAAARKRDGVPPIPVTHARKPAKPARDRWAHRRK